MKKYFSIVAKGVSCVFLLVLLFSCKGSPSQKPDSPQPPANETALTVPEKTVPEKAVPGKAVPVRPQPPEEIMGKGMIAGDKLALFLMAGNARAEAAFVRSLVGIYIEEAAAEGVNHDVAFAQMCLETGSLRYGGLVTPDMNNFCGLGATGAFGPNGPEKGIIFPDTRTGVRAHIQHLKAYASREPLKHTLVDPRYHYVKLGSSPTIHGLTGTWAADKFYGEKIAAILKSMYEFSL
jgi:hypothetical protein